MDDLKDLADLCIREVSKQGAQYAEARVHRSKGNGFMLKNGEPQPSILEDSFGMGIRVLYRGALTFSATNLLSTSTVRELSRATIKMAKASAGLTKNKVRFANAKALKRRWSATEKKAIEGADASWLRGLLGEIDGRIAEGRAGVRFLTGWLSLHPSWTPSTTSTQMGLALKAVFRGFTSSEYSRQSKAVR